MNMQEIIAKKRDAEELSTEEIEFFVNGYTDGSIPDYQASALLMAIYINKMNKRETKDLTLFMAESGDQFDLSKIEGIKVDKHSTGGIGDKTTLVVGPMVASLGIPVAKMSGRALGYDGGTIDKLESIKGFKVEMSEDEFINNVNKMKLVVAAQTGVLAPADKKIYALRDVTSTVGNLSLIASSIMSKKIAAGANSIVLDVKVGDGAFMKTVEEANALATEMVNIGEGLNRKTIAVLTDMDQPLGKAVGNALEVKEAIDTLKGNGPKDFLELCYVIASHMVVLAGKAKNTTDARKLLERTIEDGSAYNKFKEFIKAQNGDINFVENTDNLLQAKYKLPVKAKKDGFVSKIHAENVGKISMHLGAGRMTKESVIDPYVGVLLNKKRGEKVKKDDVLAYVYANDELKAQNALKELEKTYMISDEEPKFIPLVHKVIKK